MWGTRIAAVILVAVAATPVAACVPLRNMVADRELVCQDAPDALCARIADIGLPHLDLERAEAEYGRIPTLQVYLDPSGCQHPQRPQTRCWFLEATNENGAGIGVSVYEWPDGSVSAE